METFIAVCLALIVVELAVMIAVFAVAMTRVQDAAAAVEVAAYRVDQEVATFGESMRTGWGRTLKGRAVGRLARLPLRHDQVPQALVHGPVFLAQEAVPPLPRALLGLEGRRDGRVDPLRFTRAPIAPGKSSSSRETSAARCSSWNRGKWS